MITLAVVMVLLLFNTGCTQTGTVAQDYNIGKEGMVIELSTSNPASIYEKEEFGNYIMINNKGSYDVTNANPAKVIITYDTYRLSSTNYNGEIQLNGIILQGKNKVYPVGEEIPFEVYFTANPLTYLRESSTATINYNLCYPYSTQLTTMTCIDTKTASHSAAVAECTVTNYNGASGQGAPIVITKIEPEILLQNKYVRPQFKIYVENLGGGYVTNSASCSNTDINNAQSSGKVNIRAWLSSKQNGIELQCGPVETSGILRLVDSSSYITCYLPASAAGYSITSNNYVTPLIVEINYTYVSISEQKIDILRNNILPSNATQGLCESYQTYSNGQCISTCEYCSNNPTASECQKTAGFTFSKGFSCSCGLDSCNAKLNQGSCVKGYCAGDLYCCSTQVCDQYQVLYQGQCIDKCTYCADTNHPLDETICGKTDFTGFSCVDMNGTTCDLDAQQSACIRGYCGGTNINKYCANPGKINNVVIANSSN